MQKEGYNSSGLGCLVILIIIFGPSIWSNLTTPRPQYNDITHQETKERIQNNKPVYYGSNECTEDCSGHDAGYNWAMDHDICDPDACSGNSESFIEGCETYANECSGENDDSDYDDSGYDY